MSPQEFQLCEEIARLREENARLRLTCNVQSDKLLALRDQLAESQAACESMRELINTVRRSALGEGYLVEGALIGHLETALDVTPASAIRTHDLEVAEKAFREGAHTGAEPPPNLHELWLASQTRKQIEGPK